ncbi:phosphate ABC transporter permease subunit PstC, partial [Escherichia coli]|nr:phosphate ABC transporter permease subunit PstC [Escherichia coli]
VPALAANHANFLLSNDWNMDPAQLSFGILGLLWTTVITSVIAMVIVVPIAIGIALLISQYVRPRVGRAIGFVVDLLAAVPSVIFGLWGITTFAPALRPVSAFLSTYLGWIPLFSPALPVPDGSAFTAGIV